MTARCDHCDFVHGSTRQQSPFSWRCAKWPLPSKPPDGLEFVAPDYRPDPPFGRCQFKNKDGECEDFAPRRTPETGEGK